MQSIDKLRAAFNEAQQKSEECVVVSKELLWQVIDEVTQLKSKHDSLHKWMRNGPEEANKAKESSERDSKMFGEQLLKLAEEVKAIDERLHHLETHGASIIVG